MEILPTEEGFELYVGSLPIATFLSRERAELIGEMLLGHIMPRKQSDPGPLEVGLAQATQAFQREKICAALERTNGNKKAAADLLQMGRTTLLSMCKRLEIDAVELMR